MIETMADAWQLILLGVRSHLICKQRVCLYNLPPNMERKLLSDNTTTKSNPFKKLFLIYLVVDLVWAFIVATFGATILGSIGAAGGASGAATGTVTVLGWIITFVAAFIQGAIFLCVLTAFVFVFYMIYVALTRNNNSAG